MDKFLEIKMRPGAEPDEILEAYLCLQCDFQSNSRVAIKKHKERHSVKSDYQCPLCSFSLNEAYLLAAHIQMDHRNKSHRSSIPPLPNSSALRSKRKAQKRSSLRGVSSGNQGPFSCKSCDFQAASEQNLRSHELNHLVQSTFACSLCTYSSNDRKTLRRHSQRDHREKGGTTGEPKKSDEVYC